MLIKDEGDMFMGFLENLENIVNSFGERNFDDFFEIELAEFLVSESLLLPSEGFAESDDVVDIIRILSAYGETGMARVHELLTEFIDGHVDLGEVHRNTGRHNRECLRI